MAPETPKLIPVDSPPPKKGSSGRPSPITPWLAALREHPDQWFEYPDSLTTSGVGSAIANGKRGKSCYGAQPGEFEATARRTENGKAWRLFARYVGGAS